VSEKKVEVELKQEDRELLRSVIESHKPKPVEKHVEKPVKPHLTLQQLEDVDCPECKAALDAFGRKAVKAEYVRRKELESVCVDCGTGVEAEEEECPTCGGKDARERSED